MLATVGGGRIMDFGTVVGYGTGGKPDFWVGPTTTPGEAREAHIAFVAPSRKAVVAFHERAVELGAEVLHAPRRVAGVPPELLRCVRARPGRQQRRGGLPHPRPHRLTR